jgi:hypothetical protein
MERQPRKTTLRDVEEGAEVTLLAMVVRNDPKREQTLVRFPDGSQAWIAWADDTLLLAAEGLTVFVDG